MDQKGNISGEFDKTIRNSLYKVIVADDLPSARRALRHMIERLETERPIDIREAESGREALRLFTMDGGADLIITDCQMLDKDGYELTSDVRTIQDLSLYNKNPLIVMLSSLDSGDHIMKAEASGVNYVYKKGNVDHMDLILGLVKENASAQRETHGNELEDLHKKIEM